MVSTLTNKLHCSKETLNMYSETIYSNRISKDVLYSWLFNPDRLVRPLLSWCISRLVDKSIIFVWVAQHFLWASVILFVFFWFKIQVVIIYFFYFLGEGRFRSVNFLIRGKSLIYANLRMSPGVSQRRVANSV